MSFSDFFDFLKRNKSKNEILPTLQCKGGPKCIIYEEMSDHGWVPLKLETKYLIRNSCTYTLSSFRVLQGGKR